MSKADKLEQILAIKALRKRKAEIAYRQAAQNAAQIKERADNLRKRHVDKVAKARTYAQDRFMQLKETDKAEVFFTTMTIGLLRHRKDAAALGLRSKRLDQDYASARDSMRAASTDYARKSKAEDVIDGMYRTACSDADKNAEQAAEDDLTELMQGKVIQ